MASSDFRRLAETNFTKIDRKQAAFFAADPTNKDRLLSRRLRQTHRGEQSPVDRAVSRQTVAALESTDCTPGPPAHDPVDGAGVKSSAREPALHLHNQGAIHAIAALIRTVSVWVVIWVRVIERKERKTEVIENNDLIKTAMTKSIISIEVAVVETVEAGRGVKHWTALHRHRSHGSSHWSGVPSHLCRRSRDRENGWHHATEENEFFPVHNVIGSKN